MLKKIVLGLIIGAVVLTAGAGGIYAYQKTANPADEISPIDGNYYGNGEQGQGFKGMGNQYRLEQNGCDQSDCTGENCANQDCENVNCTEQYQYRQNNCYMYNNDENGDQNRNNFCYRYENNNQVSSKNCENNCEAVGNNYGNVNSKGFGKNK